MRSYRERSEAEVLQEGIESARQMAYNDICPPMSRAERRTAKGRMLIAQAETAALRAENDYLREQLGLREKPVEIVSVKAEPPVTTIVTVERDWEAINAEFQSVPMDDSRNWTEDYPHDNGQYMNLCRTCTRLFMGYKRRIQCRDCAHPKKEPENV
jgi:hypothetical protein